MYVDLTGKGLPYGLAPGEVALSQGRLSKAVLRAMTDKMLEQASVQIEDSWGGNSKTALISIDIERLHKELPPVMVGMMTNEYHAINRFAVPVHRTETRVFTVQTWTFLPTMPAFTPEFGVGTQTMVEKDTRTTSVDRLVVHVILDHDHVDTPEGAQYVVKITQHMAGSFCMQIAQRTYEALLTIIIERMVEDPRRTTGRADRMARNVGDNDRALASHRSASGMNERMIKMQNAVNYRNPADPADLLIMPANKGALLANNPLFSTFSKAGQEGADRVYDHAGVASKASGLGLGMFNGMRVILAPTMYDGYNTFSVAIRRIRFGKYFRIDDRLDRKVSGILIYSQYAANNKFLELADLVRHCQAVKPVSDKFTPAQKAVLIIMSLEYHIAKAFATGSLDAMKHAFSRIVKQMERGGVAMHQDGHYILDTNGHAFLNGADPNWSASVKGFFKNAPYMTPEVIAAVFANNAWVKWLTNSAGGLTQAEVEDIMNEREVDKHMPPAETDWLFIDLDHATKVIQSSAKSFESEAVHGHKLNLVFSPRQYSCAFTLLGLAPLETIDVTPAIIMVSGESTAFAALTAFNLVRSSDALVKTYTHTMSASHGTVIQNQRGVEGDLAMFIEGTVSGANANLISASVSDNYKKRNFAIAKPEVGSWYVVGTLKGSVSEGPYLNLTGRPHIDQIGPDNLADYEGCDYISVYHGFNGTRDDWYLEMPVESNVVARALFPTTSKTYYEDANIPPLEIWGNTIMGKTGETPAAHSVRLRGNAMFPPDRVH
jgi:hypothetical protein